MSKERSSSAHPPPRTVRPLRADDSRPKNRLLTALPADDFRRLSPHLKTIPIRLKQVLYKSGEPLRAVYFLNGGVASILTTLSDGTMVEAATVGDEGVLGIEAFLNKDTVALGERRERAALRGVRNRTACVCTSDVETDTGCLFMKHTRGHLWWHVLRVMT
jgi:CRP-like cAMP-binding protein